MYNLNPVQPPDLPSCFQQEQGTEGQTEQHRKG